MKNQERLNMRMPTKPQPKGLPKNNQPRQPQGKSNSLEKTTITEQKTNQKKKRDTRYWIQKR